MRKLLLLLLALPVLLAPAAALAVDVTGRVFHDYNGNGVQDASAQMGSYHEHSDGYLGYVEVDEPAVAGAVLSFGSHQATTDENGDYAITLPSGDYTLTVNKDAFRYIFASRAAMYKATEGMPISIGEGATLNLGLGVGPFTMPYPVGEAASWRQASFTDINPATGEVSIFDSDPMDCRMWRCTGDTHRGIDYMSDADRVVIAAAPGMVYAVGTADDGSVLIRVLHENWEGVEPAEPGSVEGPYGLHTSYQHLGRAAEGIEPGVIVQRGQSLGHLKDLGRETHLHFDLVNQSYSSPEKPGGYYLDMYRDIFRDELSFHWHVTDYGDKFYMSQGSPGFWTVDNLPQFNK